MSQTRPRIRREAGYIRGYHADLAPASLGYNVTVFAQVGLHSQAEPDLVAFENLIDSWLEVRECYMLAGETDFLLKIVAPDWETYQVFVTEKLTAAPNVANVKSALTIRASKQVPGVPVMVAEGDDLTRLPAALVDISHRPFVRIIQQLLRTSCP